jgi:translation initiation factor IF-2
MFDYRGQPVETAGPSTPVSVMGLNEVPQAGDLFRIVESEKHARNLIQGREADRERTQAQSRALTLESMFERILAGEARELRLIVKADVQGSLEPIVSSLNDLATPEISVNILHAETGNIGENDVMLATASQAIILGFNVEADNNARRLAETEGISIRLYNIIYRLTEDVAKALKGMLAPEKREVALGKAEVRAIFRIPRIGNIAGCYVTEGELRRNGRMRVVRNDEVLFEGEIGSLKHHQEDVREVRQGFECGVSLKNFNDFEEGDVLECFVIETVEIA